MFYWQPPSRVRKIEGRPAWLKSTPLRDAGGAYLTLEAAMQAAEQLNARYDQWRAGQKHATGGVAKLIGLYLKSRQFLSKAERTRVDYEKYLRLVEADLGDASPEHITPPVVARYHEHLIAQKGIGERAADYRIQVLRLMFAWARRFGHFEGDNPAARPGLKKRASRTSTWTMAQLRQLAREPYPIGLAVRLALYTLQREGDILAFRRDAIADRAIAFTQRKTGRAMILPLHPRLRAAIKLAPSHGPTLLARADGQPYTEDGFRTLLYRACKRLFGPERPTWHDIRRTAASALGAGRVPDSRVALWTGHRRKGEDAILDVYIVNQQILRDEAFPIMSRWRV